MNGSVELIALGASLLSAVLLVYACVELHQIGRETGAAQQMLRQSKRLSSIAEQFYQAFEQLRLPRHTISNTRVRWTDRLAADLASTNAHFVIEDPTILAQVSDTRSSVAQFVQYPVRVTAMLQHDRELIELLSLLQKYTSELLENRTCQISRLSSAEGMQVNCLYALYDIEIANGGTQ